jgi:hypothetical protein
LENVILLIHKTFDLLSYLLFLKLFTYLGWGSNPVLCMVGFKFTMLNHMKLLTFNHNFDLKNVNFFPGADDSHLILATQETEIRRIKVWSQPGQIVCETLTRKNPSQKRADWVAQGVDPEFKPQYCKIKKGKKCHFLSLSSSNPK